MLQRLYEDDLYKDVIFVLDSGKIVKDHRCVLLNSESIFFEKLLNSSFGDADFKVIPIRECSDDEFEFVIRSVYEIENNIQISMEKKFELATRFDTMFEVRKMFNSRRRINDLIECSMIHSPIFDKMIIDYLKLEPHSVLCDWSDNRSEIKDPDVLAYFLNINPLDSTQSIRLTHWLDSRIFIGHQPNIKNIRQYPRLIKAILKHWEPDRSTREVIQFLIEEGYIEESENKKMLEYKKIGRYFTISRYPFKAGRIFKKDETPEGEFAFYIKTFYRDNPEIVDCFEKCNASVYYI